MTITAIFETRSEAKSAAELWDGTINVWDELRYDVGPHGKARVTTSHNPCSYGKWSATFRTGNRLAMKAIEEWLTSNAFKTYPVNLRRK